MKTSTLVLTLSLSSSLLAAPAFAQDATGVDDGTCRHKHEGFFGHLVDVFEVIPGLIELTGIKFPVEHYDYKVSDALYRGSRIEGGDYSHLKEMGVKTVVDLTKEKTDDPKKVRAAGMTPIRVGIVDNTSPSNDQVKELLDIMTNPDNQPVYVHCEAGKGRTGIAVAAYRMAVEGWSSADALAEAKKFGMNDPGQENFIKNLGCDLTNGKIAGYPLQPLGSNGPSDEQKAVAQMSLDPEVKARK